jgi:PAS domain S-box-containing protein
MRIRIKKFQIAFILTFIILVVSIMSVIYFTLANKFEQKEGNRLNVSLRNSAKEIDDFMFTRVADFNVLSNNPLFSSSSSEITSQYLVRVVEQYPFYSKFFFVNKKGIILSSTNEKLIGEDLLQLEPGLQDEFIKTISGGNEEVFISDLSITSKNEMNSNQSSELKLLSDVIDLEGNVIGALVGFMNMKLLKNELIFFTDNIHVYLINNKGVVLFSEDKEVNVFQQHPDVSIKELQQQLKSGENGFYFNENSNGIKVLFEYAMLSKHGSGGVGNWFLISIVPYNEIMKPFYETVYKAVFIFLFIISLLIILLFYSSSKRVKNALLLAENREYSLKEASKVAKIGFLEDDIATETFIWSEYLYYIFGFDPEKAVPSRKEIAVLFDEESQKKMAEATFNLDTNGIPFDINLKMINLRKEEVWIRVAVEPVYNDKKEIVKRRGVIQNITDSKKTKQQIKTTLELLEREEFALHEVSKMAKIGYWEFDNNDVNIIWSEYLYDLFGLDPKKGVPQRNELISFFDENSQNKLKQANEELMSKELPFDIEIQLINEKKEKIWVRNVVQPVYNKQHKIIGRRGLLQNITAFKKAQHELEFSKQQIQNSLELLEKRDYSIREASKVAKIGFFEEDIATGTRIWSEYLYHIFGLDLEKPIPPRTELLALFDEESQQKMMKVTQDLDLKDISYDIELRLINFKNEEVWIRDVTQPIYNQQKEVIGKKGVTLDITESKNAQLQIEFSNREIQNSFDLLEKRDFSMNEASKIAKIGYLEDDFASETHIWSDNMYHIFGLNPKDKVLSSEEALALMDEESKQKVIEGSLKLDSEGIPIDIEIKLTNLREEEIWLRVVVHPVYNNQKDIVGRRGVMQDITDSKKAQFELEHSKQNLEIILEAVQENEYSLKEAGRMAKIGYWKYDTINDIIIWSEAIHQIYGNDIEKGVPGIEVILGVFTDESRKKLIDATVILASEGVSFDVELEMTNFKNEKRWIQNMGEPIYNDKKEIIGRRGVSQDITEKKIKQQTLDYQHEKLSELHNALNEAQKLSHVGSWKWNMATDEAEWSDEMYNIYGVSKGDFYPSNKNVSKTVLPEDLYKIEQGVSSLLVDKMFVPFDFRIRRPSGEIRHLYIMALEKNSQESLFGVTKDITEQKKIEEKNLIITEQYKNLFNNSTASIWIEDLSFLIAEINVLRKRKIPNIRVYLEQHPKVLFSLVEKIKVNNVNNTTLKLFKAKSHQEFFENIQYTFGSGSSKVFAKFVESIWNKKKTFTSEVNYKTLKGEEFTAVLSIPIPQTAIEQKTVPVSSQSIQSIKEAKSAKKESLNKLNEAQKLAKIGSWVLTPSTQEVEWSEEAFNIFGFNPKKGVPDFETQLKVIHPEDKEFVIEAIGLEKPFDIEHRIIQLDGVEKWIRSICNPILGDDGEVLSLAGTIQDITVQKIAADKIKKADEMYRVLTDNSTDLICLQEPDSTFQYISPSIKNLLGYEQSQFIGKKVFRLVHRDDIQLLKRAMGQKVFSGLAPEALSIRVRHKKGHFVWLEFLSSPVYKGKEVSYYVTSARDITQWVIARKEIQEYQTVLQKMTTEMTLIEEKQKKEIAVNIHDHLSQSLVISKMKINELKKNPQLKIIDKDLLFIEARVSEALENSRKITHELSPRILYQLGLIDALNWLLENTEATHQIACRMNSNITSINLSEIQSILLYRSIQEVIMNIIKYASASLITLDFDKNNLSLDILITDNGVGFDTSVLDDYHNNHSGSGFGLFTVKERIKNIQGEFTIASKINVGTTVKIIVPLTI